MEANKQRKQMLRLKAVPSSKLLFFQHHQDSNEKGTVQEMFLGLKTFTDNLILILTECNKLQSPQSAQRPFSTSTRLL